MFLAATFFAQHYFEFIHVDKYIATSLTFTAVGILFCE